jgi:hypothetical protein
MVGILQLAIWKVAGRRRKVVRSGFWRPGRVSRLCGLGGLDVTGFNGQHRASRSFGTSIPAVAGRLRRVVVLAAVSATVVALTTPLTVSAIDATPPADCSGNVGVLATPQNNAPSGAPYLTKALTSTVQGTGSTTYFYLITTNRPAASTFTELQDCAYSTVSGNPIVATYGTQQNNPSFSGGQLTISLTVNANDTVCDRVQLKGTDPSAAAFTDHSNLVGAPAGTTCLPIPVVPEAPATALLLLSAGGLAAAWFIAQRRGRRPLELR